MIGRDLNGYKQNGKEFRKWADKEGISYHDLSI